MKDVLLALAIAILCVGAVSCGKEDNGNTDQPITEWVDLGLPSGLLWASCNLGANTPEEYGNYYAWAETYPKSFYNWSSYRYCTTDDDGELLTLTKYNTDSSYGRVDNLTVLQPGDDAATVIRGRSIHTPTAEEWRELMDNTDSEWTTMNGVEGRKFTGANGNSIFLPAAGHFWDNEHYGEGTLGDYWTDTLYTITPHIALNFHFNANVQNISYYTRDYGFTVRPVSYSR